MFILIDCLVGGKSGGSFDFGTTTEMGFHGRLCDGMATTHAGRCDGYSQRRLGPRVIVQPGIFSRNIVISPIGKSHPTIVSTPTSMDLGTTATLSFPICGSRW